MGGRKGRHVGTHRTHRPFARSQLLRSPSPLEEPGASSHGLAVGFRESWGVRLGPSKRPAVTPIRDCRSDPNRP